MTRNTAVRSGNPLVVVFFWVTTLLCLRAVACFRSFDPSNLTCSMDDGCPSDHYCSNGTCVPRTPPSEVIPGTVPPT
jgi:hypothetical protein